MMCDIDFAAKENCYALLWSYGEICVGCGCCSKDPITRLSARIKYCESELEDNKNFSGWYEDDVELKALQERNVAKNIKYFEAELKRLKKELAEAQGAADGQ